MTRKAGYPAKDIQGVDGRENDGETEVGAPGGRGRGERDFELDTLLVGKELRARSGRPWGGASIYLGTQLYIRG